jgi:hypothetical protein
MRDVIGRGYGFAGAPVHHSGITERIDTVALTDTLSVLPKGHLPKAKNAEVNEMVNDLKKRTRLPHWIGRCWG